MLIKAMLQTELTKKKKKRERRDERKKIKKNQWWFLLENHNHQANPHIHQQHIDWATTFRSGRCPINMLLVNVWICLMKKRSQMCMWDFKRLWNCETDFGRLNWCQDEDKVFQRIIEWGIKLDRLINISLTAGNGFFENECRLSRQTGCCHATQWRAAQCFRWPVNFVDRRSGAVAAAFQCAMYSTSAGLNTAWERERES